MDMWIDIIDDSVAAVFCCGIAFMVNTDINIKGLPMLMDKIKTTTGELTLHVRDLSQKASACVITFTRNSYYPTLSKYNILSYLASIVTNSNSETSWDVPTDWVHIDPSALWLYSPKPTIDRFQSPNIRYTFIIINSDTTVLVFDEREKKVDLYLPSTIEGILLTGLQLKPYLEIVYPWKCTS